MKPFPFPFPPPITTEDRAHTFDICGPTDANALFTTQEKADIVLTCLHRATIDMETHVPETKKSGFRSERAYLAMKHLRDVKQARLDRA